MRSESFFPRERESLTPPSEERSKEASGLLSPVQWLDDRGRVRKTTRPTDPTENPNNRCECAAACAHVLVTGSGHAVAGAPRVLRHDRDGCSEELPKRKKFRETNDEIGQSRVQERYECKMHTRGYSDPSGIPGGRLT